MNVLFLCAALPPGRDGVGDYTRRLAGACAERGHRCAILALHDPHTDRILDGDGPVPLQRLPASLPWSERIDATERLAAAFAPDWVSWQFVAYGFSPQGLVPAELERLAAGLRPARRHLMWHELWLGLESGAGLRARWQGAWQRRTAHRFLRQLQPDCVQTSNRTYQAALAQRGTAATVLPLFGNVTIAPGPGGAEPALAAWLGSDDASRHAAFVALTFGTLHPQWKPAATADWLVRTARARSRRPALIVAGRAGRQADAARAMFVQRGVEVTVLGEQDEATISRLLRHADCGIAGHPWALLGKSGVVAAMREHGLPIVVPRNDWQLRGGLPTSGEAEDPLIAPLAALDATGTRHWLSARRPPAATLPSIAAQFLHTLDPNSPCP